MKRPHRLVPLLALFALALAAPAAAQLDPGGGLRDPAGGLRHSPLADPPQIDALAARIEVLSSHLESLAERMAATLAELEALEQARPVTPAAGSGDEAVAQYQAALARWQHERQALVTKLLALQKEAAARERELAKLSAKAPPEQQGDANRSLEAARRERARVAAALGRQPSR